MVRKFDQEFRNDAVRLALEKKMTHRQLASDLGVAMSTLKSWITAYRKGHRAVSGEGPDQKEIRRLKRENDILREERDILKKAMAIFSCPKKRGSLL